MVKQQITLATPYESVTYTKTELMTLCQYLIKDYCDRTIPKDTQDYFVAEWALKRVMPGIEPSQYSDLGCFKHRNAYMLHYFWH
ncbi:MULTISPECIES: hypothetical protein [unclassified Moorena]|uniref:hypothetical protein n=1 Tax=unclassified Moorena TaxID=2683338 RepID=UPI0013C11833|nr:MULTISPECIES: hypothetical protein [unclassified Moorena]NEO08746.1 hypothetical protein [Moorena sp. SIO3I8]NEP23064.1 hypothetical protein [Moorena sp. SIO3I6]